MRVGVLRCAALRVAASLLAAAATPATIFALVELTDQSRYSSGPTFRYALIAAMKERRITELDANGQWQNPATHQISREPTKVIIVAVPDTPATAAAISAVKDAYRAQFHQQVVGTTVAPVCAAF